jgi:hypothetical protein
MRILRDDSISRDSGERLETQAIFCRYIIQETTDIVYASVERCVPDCPAPAYTTATGRKTTYYGGSHSLARSTGYVGENHDKFLFWWSSDPGRQRPPAHQRDVTAQYQGLRKCRTGRSTTLVLQYSHRRHQNSMYWYYCACCYYERWAHHRRWLLCVQGTVTVKWRQWCVTKVLFFIIIYLLLVSRLSGHETVAQDSRLKNQETFQFLSSQMEKTTYKKHYSYSYYGTVVLNSC